MLRWVLSTVRTLDGLGGITLFRLYSHLSAAQIRHGIPRRVVKPLGPFVRAHLATRDVVEADEHCSHEAIALITLLSCNEWPNIPPSPSLKHLYHTVKSTGQKLMLDPWQYHRLLVFYGELAARSREHLWSFVIEVAEDAMALRVPLRPKAMGYLLRALLYAYRNEPSPTLLASLESLYDEVKSKPTIVDYECHVDFLRIILLCNPSRAVQDVAFFLTRVVELSEELLLFIWPSILQPGITSIDQHRLLDALLYRVTHFVNANTHLPRWFRMDPTKVFDPISESYSPPLIGIDHVCNALGSTIFPHLTVSVPAEIRKWSIEQSRAAFSADVPLHTRWQNFVCLAVAHSPEELATKLNLTQMELSHESGVVWRTVFMLSATHNLTIKYSADVDTKHLVYSVGTDLWKSYERMKVDALPPISVDRAIATSFLSLAAYARNVQLFSRVQAYIMSRHLWQLRSTTTSNEKVQIHSLIIEYLHCTQACRDLDTSDFPRLLQTPELLPQRPEVLGRLLSQLVVKDAHSAKRLWKSCLETQIELPLRVSLGVALALAPRFVKSVIPLLGRSKMPHSQRNQLVLAVIRSLYHNGESIYLLPDSLAKVLVDNLASSSKFKDDSKAFQHTLIVCARSGYHREASAVALKIAELHPRVLEPLFLRKMTTILTRERQFDLLLSLWEAMNGHEYASLESLRLYSLFWMARRGAYRNANRMSKKPSSNAREKMLHKVGFRYDAASRSQSMRVFSIARRHPTDLRTVALAMTILVKSKRPVAALRLFKRCQRHMDTEGRTLLGNILIHRPMGHFKPRNGQLVRTVLKHRDFLADRYGFVEDRVTLHIIVKAVLRWKTALDAAKVRQLFDQVVRMGYPVDVRLIPYDSYGVPFGTPPGMPLSLYLPKLDSSIDFERHVRPLYKMFIRTFYLRGDDEAARVVVKIMKAERAAMKKEWRLRHGLSNI